MNSGASCKKQDFFIHTLVFTRTLYGSSDFVLVCGNDCCFASDRTWLASDASSFCTGSDSESSTSHNSAVHVWPLTRCALQVLLSGGHHAW